MEVHVDAMLFTETQEQVPGHPDLVSGPLRSLAEDLELPLTLGHFGVDALVVDPGGEAVVEVGVHDLAGDIADVLVADARVVLALRDREADAREAERHAIPVEEVLLLEAEPGAWIVRNRRAGVAGVRRQVGQQDLAHDERAIGPGRIGVDGDRLQHAVRAAAFGLARRAAVEAPQSQLVERRKALELFDLCLAAEVRDGLVAVQPDVFQLVLGHRATGVLVIVSSVILILLVENQPKKQQKKAPRTPEGVLRPHRLAPPTKAANNTHVIARRTGDRQLGSVADDVRFTPQWMPANDI